MIVRRVHRHGYRELSQRQLRAIFWKLSQEGIKLGRARSSRTRRALPIILARGASQAPHMRGKFRLETGVLDVKTPLLAATGKARKLMDEAILVSTAAGARKATQVAHRKLEEYRQRIRRRFLMGQTDEAIRRPLRQAARKAGVDFEGDIWVSGRPKQVTINPQMTKEGFHGWELADFSAIQAARDQFFQALKPYRKEISRSGYTLISPRSRLQLGLAREALKGRAISSEQHTGTAQVAQDLIRHAAAQQALHETRIPGMKQVWYRIPKELVPQARSLRQQAMMDQFFGQHPARNKLTPYEKYARSLQHAANVKALEKLLPKYPGKTYKTPDLTALALSRAQKPLRASGKVTTVQRVSSEATKRFLEKHSEHYATIRRTPVVRSPIPTAPGMGRLIEREGKRAKVPYEPGVKTRTMTSRELLHSGHPEAAKAREFYKQHPEFYRTRMKAKRSRRRRLVR